MNVGGKILNFVNAIFYLEKTSCGFLEIYTYKRES